MDFASLLAQHTQASKAKSSWADAEDEEDYDFKEKKNKATAVVDDDALVSGLMGSLSTPRGAGDDGGERQQRPRRQSEGRGGRRGGKGGGRGGRGGGGGRGNRPRGDSNRGMRHDFENMAQDAGHVEENMDGSVVMDAVMGQYPLWKETWKSPEVGNIIVKFKAKGEDNVVVGLSPFANATDPMYEIVLGGWKNTKSIIRTKTQGPERAVSTEPRVCTAGEWRSYWVRLKDGSVSVGVGDVVGQGVVLGWKDPAAYAVKAQYASFTTWDRRVVYTDVQVNADENDDMEEVEYTKYQPSYLEKFNDERVKAQERATRFDVHYLEPDMNRMNEELLSPEEREQLRIARIKEKNASGGRNDGGGFATGFDPMTEEEKEKKDARARRFNTKTQAEKDAEAAAREAESYASRTKREQRASRFGVTVNEDVRLANAISNVAANLRVPRVDALPADQRRMDAIHVYGALDGVYTKDVNLLFEEYGPSHIEWLHDCALNVVFGDEVTAKRALTGVGKEIPNVSTVLMQPVVPTTTAIYSAVAVANETSTKDEVQGDTEMGGNSGDVDDADAAAATTTASDAAADADAVVAAGVEVNPNSPAALRKAGWLQSILNRKVVLVRYATVSDVKADSKSGFRSGRFGGGGGGRGRGGRGGRVAGGGGRGGKRKTGGGGGGMDAPLRTGRKRRGMDIDSEGEHEDVGDMSVGAVKAEGDGNDDDMAAKRAKMTDE